jgi:hypothetical protein
MSITIGNQKLVVRTAAEKVNELIFTALVWGPSGAGKTTLAATAPGRKLWLNIGNQETDSIVGDVPDTHIIDLDVMEPRDVILGLQQKSLLGLQEALDSGEIEFDTLVLDHGTALVDYALKYGVTKVTVKSGQPPSYEEPGPGGYGRRNTETKKCIDNIRRFCGINKKNLIVIVHEDAEKDKQGAIEHFSTSLGGKLNTQVPNNFSEVWYMLDTGHERKIFVRPFANHRPMKSRMFKGTNPFFKWQFDANDWNSKKNEGYRLVDWIDKWKSEDGKRQELPK